MITSIAELCTKKGILLTDTVYKSSNPEMVDFKIVSGDFYEFVSADGACQMLRYKNCLDLVDFSMLCEKLPLLSNIDYKKKLGLPYFTDGLTDIADCIVRGERIAVEGGPCLFGTNEVMIEVVLHDGSKNYFDYNTGKRYFKEDHDDENDNFAEYVKHFAGEISDLHFENKKEGLTPQEWAFIKYPFEIAEKLDAPLVIPIPDMSYAKYLTAVLADVDENVRKEALLEFRTISHEICDLYLELIEQVKLLHNTVHCDVVHERDEALCKKYYEARSMHMDRNRVERTLTGIPEKFESVKDYVSMPALPYYLYGIKNVIEVDSMDEADSYRKCKKAHKGFLNLSCILFPELLSSDGVHTIFDAPWDRKEYGHYVVS